jgi:hypothetical protein
VLVGHCQPLSPDECDYDVGLSEDSFDHFDEVVARPDGVDVHEHAVGAELGGEAGKEVPGMAPPRTALSPLKLSRENDR